MVKGRYIEGIDNMSEVLRIRGAVFGDEYGIEAAAEPSADDAMAVHAVAYNDNDEIVAAGSLYFDGETFTIDKIAVLEGYRGQYYGDFVLKVLIDKASQAHASEIYGNAFVGATGFMETVGYAAHGTAYELGDNKVQPMILTSEKFANGCGSCCKH